MDFAASSTDALAGRTDYRLPLAGFLRARRGMLWLVGLGRATDSMGLSSAIGPSAQGSLPEGQTG
jgi:hypothetical protein